MKAVVYCADPEDEAYKAGLAKISEGGEAPALLPLPAGNRAPKAKAGAAVSYFDADAAPLERLLELGPKAGAKGPWGVFDRGGKIVDPARLFQAGAADYLGPGLAKKGPAFTRERMERAIGLFERWCAGCPEEAEAGSEACSAPMEIPPFPGWDKLKEDKVYPFTFFYASLAGQSSIFAQIGEKRMDKLRADFSAFMGAWAEERGGKIWMRDASSLLVLFPLSAGKEEADNPAAQAFRLMLDRTIIGYEHFRMELPVDFRFALHCGEVPWRKPGTTGTVVSEHVNFIYHFGMKAVGDGRMGISDQAKRYLVPAMADLFAEGKSFEGHRVWYSKKIR